MCTVKTVSTIQNEEIHEVKKTNNRNVLSNW